jgi:transcriptional regulator with XRE-family HTH domain
MLRFRVAVDVRFTLITIYQWVALSQEIPLRQTPSIAEEVRKFRIACGQTQAQFAVTLGLAPTSVYRYEAGTGIPDFPVIKKLLEYAVSKGNGEAQYFFMTLLADRMGLSKGELDVPREIHEFSALRHVRFQGQAISSQEYLYMAALLLYLRSVKDETTSRVLDALLGPWLTKTKDLLTEGATGEPSPTPMGKSVKSRKTS